MSLINLSIIYLMCIQGSNVAIVQNPCSNRFLIITAIFRISYYSHFTFWNLSFFLAHGKVNRGCPKMFCTKVLRNSVIVPTYAEGLHHRRFQNNFDKFLRIAMDLLLKRLSWNLGQEKANRTGVRNKIS